jgi:PAS domain S-box-containing protein
MIRNEDRTQAEREFRKLRDVLPQYMCVYGADGSPLYANDELLDFFGFTLDDFRADDFYARVFHPADLERVRTVRWNAMSRGDGWEIEARILRKDGQYCWFLIRGKPLRDENGNIVRWFSSGTDIEDRKRAQWEIEQLVDAVPQHLVVLSREGRRLYANKAARDYHGMTLEEFLAEDVPPKCFYPGDFEGYVRVRNAGIASGRPWETEARLLRKDGQYRWFLYRANPLRDEQGVVIRWYISRTDIEERKQAEGALRRNEAYLAEAQRLSHSGSWAFDIRSQEITHWSEETYRAWGYDPKQAPISYPETRRRIHPDDVQLFDESKQRAIAEHTPQEYEFRIVLPEGVTKYMHCVCRAVINTSGEAVELVGTMMDITEQHQARTALQKAFDEIS